jgi:hypothetical protein
MDGRDGRDGVNDDFEVEVSDLRRAPAADPPPIGQRAEGSAREEAADRGPEPEALGAADAPEARGTSTEVEFAGMPAAQVVDHTAWRPAQRSAARLFAARRVRGYAVAVLVVLVCAGLLLSLPGTRQALRQALVRPTPTATVPLAPGGNLIYFDQTAPWGRLTIDGRPVVPQFGQTSSLSRGHHSLTYEAAPWPALRCQLSVPEQQDDTCPVQASIQYGNAPLARVVDLGATADRLPGVQQAALTSAVVRALQADVETTAVPPGDHYRGADGRIAVATLPLQASLELTLNTDATRAASNTLVAAPGPCVSLCSPPGFGGGAAAWWGVWAHVIAHWHFVAADGTSIDPGTSADVDAAYPVGAAWAASELGAGGGSWSVTLHAYADSVADHGYVCFPAFQQAFPNGAPPLPSTSGFSEEGHPGPSEVEGCVLIVSPGSNGGEPLAPNTTPNATAPTPTPTPLPADAAIFIARFGMVLAGNAAAHTAQPQLPIASAHEQLLAQQWIALPQP